MLTCIIHINYATHLMKVKYTEFRDFFHTNNLSLPHKHTHSHTLSHTHTRTHTLSLSLTHTQVRILISAQSHIDVKVMEPKTECCPHLYHSHMQSQVLRTIILESIILSAFRFFRGHD